MDFLFVPVSILLNVASSGNAVRHFFSSVFICISAANSEQGYLSTSVMCSVITDFTETCYEQLSDGYPPLN